MNKACNQYRITIRATGRLAAEGTMSECAAQLGLAVPSVRNLVTSKSKKYCVESDIQEKIATAEMQRLAAQWDAYVKKFVKWLDGGCKRSNFPFEV